MTELKKCPCGKTPNGLLIEEGSTSRWGYAYGDCCSEWMIEFRSVNNNPMSPESYDMAVKYWNDSPRARELE